MYESAPEPIAASLDSKAAPNPEIQGLAANAHQALTLCLEAIAPDLEDTRCWDILEALETLLPSLELSEVEAVLTVPHYQAIRSQLLQVRADTWFSHECELARQALAHDGASALNNMFGEHIPREAYADELTVLHQLKPQNILIIGSGACPMSAVVIQDAFPRSTVVGLDRSLEACELSARLLARSGFSAIKIQQGDAETCLAIDEFDCIIMALTVGVDEADKRRIIKKLKSRANPHTFLVARTAVDWGRVLYPAIDLPEIAAKAAFQHASSSQQRSLGIAIRMDELQD
jgi:hypothetical protein